MNRLMETRRLMERFVGYAKGPFSLSEAIAETGLPEPRAARLLLELEVSGLVREIRDEIYIPITKRPQGRIQYDYRVRKSSLIEIMELVGDDWVYIKDLSPAGMRGVSINRAVKTLCHMGLLEWRKKSRSTQVRRVKSYSGERIPKYWKEVSKLRFR